MAIMRLLREAAMFQRINPDELNGRQKEIYNFQKSAALLADYGFNCIKRTDDWLGADFLAHHFDGSTTLKVQLKARLTIDRKYAGHDLWMNFPCKGTWYLVPHDDLVELVGQTTNWLNTSSWQENGAYSSTNPSPALLDQLRPYNVKDQPEPLDGSPNETNEAPDLPTQPRPHSRRRQAPTTTESGYWRHPNLAAAERALTAAGYSCSPPPGEWKGSYLTARPRDGATNMIVRCPGRPRIQKDHIGMNLFVAFPDQDGVWYLIEHDELVRVVETNTPWLESDSWRVNGAYSSVNPSRRMRSALRRFALNAT